MPNKTIASRTRNTGRLARRDFVSGFFLESLRTQIVSSTKIEMNGPGQNTRLLAAGRRELHAADPKNVRLPRPWSCFVELAARYLKK